MEGDFSLKRFLGHRCPDLNQLSGECRVYAITLIYRTRKICYNISQIFIVPLNTSVIRNAVWTHFESFTCHPADEIVARTQYSMDDEVSCGLNDGEVSLTCGAV